MAGAGRVCVRGLGGNENDAAGKSVSTGMLLPPGPARLHVTSLEEESITAGKMLPHPLASRGPMLEVLDTMPTKPLRREVRPSKESQGRNPRRGVQPVAPSATSQERVTPLGVLTERLPNSVPVHFPERPGADFIGEGALGL
mmetsp:Transcript_7625/g.17959  ORF Transcript_7625/g.17959 Transcript_7625/m.17959 type:complete len:142 (+) Transcript_7625:1030-1455(+)